MMRRRTICGIVGAVGKIYGKEEDVFKLLSQFDIVRGQDSTGICSVTKNDNDWVTLKDVGNSYDMFSTKDFGDLMKRTHLMLFGHNRAATRGVVNQENAHPFHHGDIVGCHNGTLTSVSNLEDHEKFKVDSENIFYDMSKNGAKATIAKLQGAFALCWYDEKSRTVNLVRNNQRPLYYCYSKDHKTLFWASESWMLHVAMQRVGIERDDIHLLTEGQLFTVDVPRVTGSQVDRIEHRQEGVDFYKFTQSWEGGYSWYSASKRREDASEAFKETKKTYETGKKTGNIIPFKGGKAEKISVARFLGKTVVFSVIGKGKQGNLEHIKCEVEDVINPPEIRVFCANNAKLYNLLLNSPMLFKGKVKSVSNTDSPYMVCDNRTIVEVEYTDHSALNDDDEAAIIKLSQDDAAASMRNEQQDELTLDTEVFEGYNGRKMNRDQYAIATQGGCCMCGDYASICGKDEIVWAGPSEYFCARCAITDFGQEYLNPKQTTNKVH